MNKDVAIFIDTNIAQTFIGGNVYFSKLDIPSQYYELTTFIEENRLNGRIEICFPETVVKEMKSHMIKGFVSANNAIVESICGFKKIYGDLLDIEFQVRIPEEEYPQYVESLFKDFFSNPRNCCKVVEHPRNNELIDVLLDKAITGIKPFFTGGIAGKKHSDAGFKDSLIAETIYSYCTNNSKIGVLISDDVDFSDVFERRLHKKSDFVIFRSIQDAIKALEDYFETNTEKRLKREFTENTYWHEYLLNSIEQEYDASVTSVTVDSVSQCEDNEYNINITMIVNETTYEFTVNFDAVANDIIDSKCHIEND